MIRRNKQEREHFSYIYKDFYSVTFPVDYSTCIVELSIPATANRISGENIASTLRVATIPADGELSQFFKKDIRGFSAFLKALLLVSIRDYIVKESPLNR